MSSIEAETPSLSMARALVRHLESGNQDEANRLLEDLSRAQESSLFQELGKLTRELHEAMNSFRLDSRISDLTEKDIPDAKDRLNYVIAMTEQAAHRTLDLVEQTLPVSDHIQTRATALRNDWDRFQQREMKPEEFRQLSRELRDFLARLETDAATVHNNLSSVLMAQDYQDITGQIIRRVINLVHEVEENLVGLIRLCGKRMVPVTAAVAAKPVAVNQVERSELDGPRVPGLDTKGVVSDQDDVDDLLSSLGF